MTAPLELQYRRLLAIYPAAHRQAYEEEMVGVLMAAAQPGQRRPGLGDTVDLLRSGMVARLGRGARGMRTAGWRDAAVVVALIGIVMLAAAPGRRLVLALGYARQSGDPLRGFGVDGGLLIDVAVRSAAWLAVLVAVLLAVRRTAVALGVVALLVELAAMAVWLPAQQFRIIEMSWVLVLAPLTVALLVLSRRAGPVFTVLGRRGSVLIGSGVLLAAGGALVRDRWQPPVLGLISVAEALVVTAGVVLVAGLLRMSVASRRRTLVLLAPVLAVPVAQQMLERTVDLGFARSVTPGIVLTGVLTMAGVPLLAFVAGVVGLHLRENVTVSMKPAGKEPAA